MSTRDTACNLDFITIAAQVQKARDGLVRRRMVGRFTAEGGARRWGGLKEEMVVADSNWQDRSKNWAKENTGEWFCRGLRSAECSNEQLEWIKRWSLMKMDEEESAGEASETWRWWEWPLGRRLYVQQLLLCPRRTQVTSSFLWPVTELEIRAVG